MKAILLAAASALVLSAGVASATPAVTESGVNVRSGPGTQYSVIGALPANATVDVAGCDSGWCQIGSGGYVSAAYLDLAGGPGPVAAAPDAYSDDYDYGPGYGVAVVPGFYYGSGVRHHRHRHGGHWQHGPGRTTAIQPGPRAPTVRPGQTFTRHNIGPRNFGINRGAPRVSAPVGLRTGGPSIGRSMGPRMHTGGPSMHVGGPGRHGRR